MRQVRVMSHDIELAEFRQSRFGEGCELRIEVRMRYAFIHTYKPVLDDASFRAFETMEDYRRWCESQLPDWLGYGRV